jgi:hypothetical protein
MHFFVKVTAIVAVALVALVVLAFVLKILIVAALVAALVVGGVAIARLFSRRPRAIVTYDPRTDYARRYR